MAMNPFANHPSVSQRQKLFARFLIGDFTFALEQNKVRQKQFLQRNIARILRYHEQRLKRDPTSTTSRPISEANPHTTDQVSYGNAPRPTESAHLVEEGPTNGASSLVQAASTSVQASSTGVNMAATSQSNPRDDQQRGRSTRRSGRFKEIVDRIHDQVDAELILDLSNIRKKLNFKSNALDEGERPAKRQKRNTVKCYCHLTIWDNRDGFAAVPLTTKSAYCYVTGSDNGVYGPFVDLELEKPFVVKASEIRVPVTTKKVSALEIIDNYFLEFKIIPCRADSRWPPMPILGKSDGDHFGHDIKKGGSEELQGAIVARYTHLPTAPDVNIPLSVFFMHEGRTYRTKYGLQVISNWQKAGTAYIKQESKGLDLDSFLRNQPTDASLPEKKKRGPKPQSAPPPKPPPKPLPQHQPEVCYSLSGRMAEISDVAQEFRNATTKGYCCPLCEAMTFHKLQYLQFHLTTSHSKYNFSVQKPRRDPLTNELLQVHIKVDQPTKPVIKKEETETDMKWIAPAAPFDLKAFVSGDRSWTSDTPVPKLQAPSSSRPTTGYPLAKNVADFRKADRKKWKAITLETKHAQDEPESVHTSISHRAVSPSEEARSETDDEIDNEWQIDTHMERLDLLAAKENWSQWKRELTKRWDRHRMEEQLEHSLYLSNSLIRFVGKQKEWLRGSGDDELLQCFFDFLLLLKDRRAIDDNVIADVNELIFVDAPAPTSPVKLAGQRHATPVATARRDMSRSRGPEAAKARAQDSSPPPTQPGPLVANTCSICTEPLKDHHKSITFCQDPECTTALQKFHKKCVLAPPVSQKGKEKAVAAPVAPQDEAVALKTWCCKSCVARQKDRLKAKEEEREEKRRREREIVENGARMFLGSMA
ncbi:hypothetical protein H2200_000955 [Cladophialophora chaetospira]|uniref:Polycomb protein VEFS-Box domain-containing protein n=1 Tax=Cladophialophora chaetospira TaxID=386627 RepID=A0AA38XQI7_9EURO|nr:hypothetical protein H2200_000955 [Cladophialophora chaetospira]